MRLHFQAVYSGDILASKYKLTSDSLLLFASSPPGSSVQGDSPGKNTGVGCHALLRDIFPSQGSNWHLFCLLCWQMGSLLLALPGKPNQWAWNVFFQLGLCHISTLELGVRVEDTPPTHEQKLKNRGSSPTWIFIIVLKYQMGIKSGIKQGDIFH